MPSYLSTATSPSGSPSSSIILGKANGYGGLQSAGANGAGAVPLPPVNTAEPAAMSNPLPDVFGGKPYAHRMPDGSNNNPLFPDLGRAGMPYARSVAPTRPVPLSSLPDAGVLFDVLLRRDKV